MQRLRTAGSTGPRWGESDVTNFRLFEPLQRFDFVGIQKTESPLTKGACWLRVRTFLEGQPIESFALHFGSSIEFESLTQFNVVRPPTVLGREAEGFFKQKEILDPNYFDGLGNLFVFLATRGEDSLQWIGQKAFEIESERLSDLCFRGYGP